MVTNVCSTMVVVIKFVTTVVEERSNVLVELDINWLMIRRPVLVRNIVLRYVSYIVTKVR